MFSQIRVGVGGKSYIRRRAISGELVGGQALLFSARHPARDILAHAIFRFGKDRVASGGRSPLRLLRSRLALLNHRAFPWCLE